MKHYTTGYILKNENESIYFDSEKEACSYLGVARCSVSSCYRKNVLCKGYVIERVGITTHNNSRTRLYKIWDGMKERCYRPKHPHYKDYGGRGIKVCDEWIGEQGFYCFKEWAMSNGYSENLTLDRIDNDGNYEPSNCRWVTVKEQMNNKRSNHFINVGNECLTIAQCSEKYKIPKSTIRWRVEHGRNVIDGTKIDEEGKIENTRKDCLTCKHHFFSDMYLECHLVDKTLNENRTNCHYWEEE